MAAALALASLVPVAVAPTAAATTARITSRGAATSVTYASDSTRSLTLSVPGGAQTGDVLIASLGFGKSSASTQPRLTAPPGWTLVSRTNRGSVAALAVFWHVLGAGERTYTWTTDLRVGGAAFLAALGGVDAANPVEASAGRSATGATSISTPSVTTTGADALLVAGWYGYTSRYRPTTWSPPAGMSEVGDATNGASRSGSIDYGVQATAGVSGVRTATASVSQDYAIGVLTALRPARGAPDPGGPVPLIVDTDIFSDADDVGALATGFALQRRGEARVIAIGVNTRTSRPAVATNSWKCAAAVAQFYGAGDTPIGTHWPNNGTDTNTDEFVGPCSRLAWRSTPTPDTAVRVFRRALVGQADGSVVIAEAGYSGNLADLLDSPADAISPLTGRELVARKVRMLVIMAGGYPSRSGENNLIGDPAAAQAVAGTWPTRIVWSGYEVGDAVHTGNTISRTHPAASPVRVAYEAFVGPDKWIYSYDLTAVYHAVRPADPRLTPVGPGRNSITGGGGNTFTTGSGNQYYLRLSDPSALASSIEGLLGAVP